MINLICCDLFDRTKTHHLQHVLCFLDKRISVMVTAQRDPLKLEHDWYNYNPPLFLCLEDQHVTSPLLKFSHVPKRAYREQLLNQNILAVTWLVYIVLEVPLEQVSWVDFLLRAPNKMIQVRLEKQ